jgi:hypothetical protein
MRIGLAGLFCLLLSLNGWAETDVHKIIIPLSAEQWVTTKSALVTVGVSASMSGAALEKIQDQILQKLNRLTNQGEWHIIAYERSLDKSGLERAQITAQARIPITALTNLREQAKTLSQPGETFSIDNMQFTPSETELRDANTLLRMDIYQQAKDEFARINKMYPEQKYFVYEINFTSNNPQPVAYRAMNIQQARAETPASNMEVGDKLVLNAMVTLGSEQTQIRNLHI